MRKGWILFILLVALGVAIVIFAKNTFQDPPVTTTPSNENIPARSAPTVTVIDPVRGPQDASVTIVEFGDYLCEACRQIDSVLREVLAAYPTNVRLVWKDFPNDEFHPGATRAAEAARCAGAQGKYWEYHDLLLERTGFGLIPYADLAAEVSINAAAFDECLASGAMQPVIDYTAREAQALGITGVPAFFINGAPFDGTTFAEFEAVIENIVDSR